MQQPATGTDPTEGPSGTWHAVVRVARAHGGWIVALAGALLCAAGWYGVSGEKYEARQVPYLASATVPGAALIVAGSVLVAARSRADAAADDPTRRMVADLHALLLEPSPRGPASARGEASAPGPAAELPDAGPVAVPGATRYHRPGCALTVGHGEVEAVTAERVAELGLVPCPLCDPAPPAAG